MPNYVANTIAVKGEKQKVVEFFNAGLQGKKINVKMSDHDIWGVLENGKLALSSFIPMPKTFSEWDTTNQIISKQMWDRLEEKPHGIEDYDEYVKQYKAAAEYQQRTYGVVGWYAWRLLNYGIKWDEDFSDFEVYSTDDELLIYFFVQTPWSCPGNWLHSVQKKFEDITFFCRSSEESGEFNGYYCVKEGDVWPEDHQYLYSDCWDEIAKEYSSERELTDDEQDEIEQRASALENQKNEEIDLRFREFVTDY